ncbi:MAG: regulatory protein RecX [Solirubrobacteraceae bacterium]
MKEVFTPEPLAPGSLAAVTSTAESPDATPPRRALLDQAFELAYRRLGRRDHTEMQLRERLERAGFEASLVREVLSTLAAQGYVDDERFARRLVEDRRSLDGWGTRRIRTALTRAGVAEATIAQRLDGAADHDELDAAVSLLASRLRERPCDEPSRARALGFLLRRGYDSDLAYEAVRRLERAG